MAEGSNLSVSRLFEQSRVLYRLGTLIKTGVPILDALKIMAARSKDYEPVFTAIHDHVRDGECFQDTAAKFPDHFLPFVPALIGIGEETGNLDTVLISSSRLVKRVAQITTTLNANDLKPGDTVTWRDLDIAVDFYMLSLLIDAGIPLLRSLQIMSSGSSEPNRKVFDVMSERVGAGESLSVALEGACGTLQIPKGGRLLSDGYNVAIIQAGEIGGILDIVLVNLANAMMWDALDIEIE